MGEYILGGWCIGTVLDSAASRAMMHAQQIRTSQSSMAINVNVNVEWWDADKLHSHYMDVDRGHYAEGEHPSIEIATKNGTPLTDAARAALPPTMRQVPQSTVMQRNQTSMRDVDTYTRELEKEVKQTLSAVIPGNTVLGYDLDAQTTEVGVDAAEKATLDQIRGSEVADRIAKRDLAVRRLTTGKGEYEGVYVRPDPRGIDVDPHGRVIYDQREGDRRRLPAWRRGGGAGRPSPVVGGGPAAVVGSDAGGRNRVGCVRTARCVCAWWWHVAAPPLTMVCKS